VLQRVSPDVKLRAFLFNDLILFAKEDKEKGTFKPYGQVCIPHKLSQKRRRQREKDNERKSLHFLMIFFIQPLLLWLVEVQGTGKSEKKYKRVSLMNQKGPEEAGDLPKNFALHDVGTDSLYELKTNSPRDRIV